jgi:nucleotide-binding universal stress UspA family protein
MSTALASVVAIPQRLTIKRILYATDFSEGSLAALPIVTALARRFDSTVCVAHIWSALPARMISTAAAISEYDQLQGAACEQMDELLKREEFEHIHVLPLVVEGNAAERLTPVLADEAIDLVVVGTQGRSGLKKLFLGSVAEAICRTATCPVLTVGPNIDPRFNSVQTIKSILCPIDLSGQSASILPYAASVAKEFDSDMSLLHVLPAGVAQKDIAGNLARRLRQELQNLCRLHVSPRREANLRVEFGDPVETILHVSGLMNADVIALGIRPALPFGLRFQDTVTYKIITGAACPVLTYRSRWWM